MNSEKQKGNQLLERNIFLRKEGSRSREIAMYPSGMDTEG